MDLLSGINHVAVVTDDLERFVEFYTGVFDLEVVFEESTPAFRHAILRTGTESWLHPAEVAGNGNGAGLPTMFERGHVDHFALTATSAAAFEELRRRLVARGASAGAVDDLGAFRSVWFEDPDGTRLELIVILDDARRDIHEPRPLDGVNGR